MGKAISDALEDWPTVDASLPKPERGLLLGNGASIALWPKFRYDSLFAVAQDVSKPEHLHEQDVAVFSTLETKNFEAVLSALIIAGRVWGIYDKPKEDIDDLRATYRRVRTSLIRSVKEVHVPFDRVTDALKAHLREVFASYSYVYSSNYDLLTYWAMMKDREHFKDFFWGQDTESQRNLFDVTDTDLWEDGKKAFTKVLFLHGALHLYKNHDGRTFKKLSGDDGNLLAQFDVREDAIPLFISEGTSKDKLSAIARSDYLSFAYERFSKHRGSLVVFGHSLTPAFDQHLIDAMKKWKRYDQRRRSFQVVPDRRVVAVSVRPDGDSNSIIEMKSRLGAALPDYDLRFFDSRTHPLGDDKWNVSASG
jgi:hypothetical protein